MAAPSPAPLEITIPRFEENARKYRVCCCHIKRLAMATFVVDLVFGFLFAVSVAVIVSVKNPNKLGLGIFAALNIFAWTVGLTYMLYAGVKSERYVLIILYLSLSSLYFLVGVAMAIAAFIIFLADLNFLGWVAFGFVALFITFRALLQANLMRFYFYIREKQEFAALNAAIFYDPDQMRVVCSDLID